MSRTITADLIAAIAASAYNVCGPMSGAYATPSTVASFDRATVSACIEKYETAHDGTLFSVAEIQAARAFYAAGGGA